MAPPYLTQVIANIVIIIVKPLIALMIGAGLVYFLYGVFVFLKSFDDETERAQGKKHMVWGIVGLFIMVGVYGIIQIVANTFGVSTAALP